jgi:hypothetical protein
VSGQVQCDGIALTFSYAQSPGLYTDFSFCFIFGRWRSLFNVVDVLQVNICCLQQHV